MADAATPVRLNKQKHQFELDTNGKQSIVVYQPIEDGVIALVHTEVDPALEGHGVGSKLVEQTLTYIEQQDWKIVPLCPFVSTYLKRHPEWNRLVSEDYSPSDV